MGLKPGIKPVPPPPPPRTVKPTQVRDKDPLKDPYSFENQMITLRQDVADGKHKGVRSKTDECPECGMDTVWDYEVHQSFKYCCICDFFYIHVPGRIIREIKQ